MSGFFSYFRFLWEWDIYNASSDEACLPAILGD